MSSSAEASALPVSNKEGKKKKKEDKEFEYEKQADDEGTLEEEEKLEQADAKVNCAPSRAPVVKSARLVTHPIVLLGTVLTAVPTSCIGITERTLEARGRSESAHRGGHSSHAGRGCRGRRR